MLQATHSALLFILKSESQTVRQIADLARITANGKRIEISIKRSIEEQNWNATKGAARGSREEMVKLNKFLDQYKAGVVESYQELLLQRKWITAELLKEKVTGMDHFEFTLCKLMECHNQEQGLVLEPGMMKNYYTTQKYLKEFLRVRFKTADKYLTELNYSSLPISSTI